MTRPAHGAPYGFQHSLYRTGDADAPAVIKDQNGDVVLALCRLCDQAEVELTPTCPVARARDEVERDFCAALTGEADIDTINRVTTLYLKMREGELVNPYRKVAE